MWLKKQAGQTSDNKHIRGKLLCWATLTSLSYSVRFWKLFLYKQGSHLFYSMIWWLIFWLTLEWHILGTNLINMCCHMLMYFFYTDQNISLCKTACCRYYAYKTSDIPTCPNTICLSLIRKCKHPYITLLTCSIICLMLIFYILVFHLSILFFLFVSVSLLFIHSYVSQLLFLL